VELAGAFVAELDRSPIRALSMKLSMNLALRQPSVASTVAETAVDAHVVYSCQVN
jgi:hypothetical protein